MLYIWNCKWTYDKSCKQRRQKSRLMKSSVLQKRQYLCMTQAGDVAKRTAARGQRVPQVLKEVPGAPVEALPARALLLSCSSIHVTLVET